MDAETLSVNSVPASEIVLFWRHAGAERWFAKDKAFDAIIRTRFLGIYEAAVRSEFATWRQNPEGSLALLILFDQFSRNLFRGSARAFACDPLARTIAHHALLRGFDQAIERVMRPFFYLPFMHSETLADQERSVQLYAQYGDEKQRIDAERHRDIILTFGRFPHRNHAMNRNTTAAERAFLDAGGFTA
jgi:uncharacterized protein (DUF924 family)